jgi:hypothetical protein
MDLITEDFYDIMSEFARDEGIILQKVNSTSVKTWSSSTSVGTYIDGKIVEKINTDMRTHLNINMMVADTTVDLNIIGKSETEVMSYRVPVTLILATYMHFMKTRFQMSWRTPLILHVYLTDAKKKFPKNLAQLGPLNVNTGYTVGNNIVIYRKEELIKVLIHELTHYVGLDDIAVPEDIEKQIRDHFNVTNSVYLREAITEFWACTMNIAYYTYLDLKQHEKSKPIFKRRFVNHLIKETKFCEEQARRVAHRIGYCEDKQHAEKTHVISYYIIKYIMLHHWNRYIPLYKQPGDKQGILDLLISHLGTIKKIMCEKKPHSKTSLKMTSLDVMKMHKMKTI